MTRALLLALRAYRFALSPWLGAQCRFAPTCSQYAIDAIERHGPWRGCLLAARRLLRCHPWHAGGWDPVPDGAFAGSGRCAGGECGHEGSVPRNGRHDGN